MRIGRIYSAQIISTRSIASFGDNPACTYRGGAPLSLIVYVKVNGNRRRYHSVQVRLWMTTCGLIDISTASLACEVMTMHRYPQWLVLGIIVLAIAPSKSFADGHYDRAGAILCTSTGGVVQVLMGVDQGRIGWANFVGGPKPVDRGDPINTAIREVHEESRCQIPVGDLKAAMLGGSINPRVERQVGFPLFIVNWPNLGIPRQQAPTSCTDMEKTIFALIPLPDIEITVQTPGSQVGSTGRPLYKHAATDFNPAVIARMRQLCR